MKKTMVLSLFIVIFTFLQVASTSTPQVPLVVQIVNSEYKLMGNTIVKIGEKVCPYQTVYLVAKFKIAELNYSYKPTAIATTNQDGIAFFEIMPASLVNLKGIALPNQTTGLYGTVNSYFPKLFTFGKINKIDLKVTPTVPILDTKPGSGALLQDETLKKLGGESISSDAFYKGLPVKDR